MNRPGTALQAITFALDHIDSPFVFLDFMGTWHSGIHDQEATCEMIWPDYLSWLQSDEAKKIGEDDGRS